MINFDTDPMRARQITPEISRTDKSIPFMKNNMDARQAGGLVVSVGDAGLGIVPDSEKGMSDFAAGLDATDVQLKTDYMSVMSLSMSDDDYAELVRTGRVPEDMEAGDSVTILDDIKAALIKGGADIAGYTDTLDRDTLVQITGSQTSADALIKKVSDAGLDTEVLADIMHRQDVPVTPESIAAIADAVTLTREVLPLSDDAAAYLIDNGRSPVVENIYQASNSGSSPNHGGGRYVSQDGYVGKVSGSEDIDGLRPQIEETIEKSGLYVNEDTLSDAKMLLERGIPLTWENLLELDSLRNLRSGAEPEDIANSAAIAMSAGISPMKANLTYDESIYVQAQNIIDEINAIPDEAADAVVEEGRILNIRNLRIAAGQLDMAGADSGLSAGMAAKVLNEEDTSPDILHARRVLEEVRITMSVEANRMLIRSNLSIDITPMEELVDALKEAEKAFAGRLFPETDDKTARDGVSIYRETGKIIDDIYAAPAAILGQYRSTGVLRFGAEETFTLSEVQEAGNHARQDYILAGETYEALMTAPRADMGDSIKKAFSNVDDILKDMQIETDELNRRAVRILGYNSMEITEASIEQVRSADINLRSVIARLTPDRVISMIREDVNPLDMTIQELGEYLDDQDRQPEKQAADYARFLMQLERADQIDELERDSYIGIYRMITKLDRTEDAALGRLISMGSELSFSNLLSAMKSTAKGQMDYRVDDAFGGVDLIRKNSSIEDQINAAFSADSVIRNTPVNETVIENLLMSGNEATFSDLEAFSAIKNKRGDYIRPVADQIAKAKEAGIASGISDISGLSDGVIDSMTDRETTAQVYSDMLEGIKADLADAVFNTADIMDIRAIRSSMKQVNILTGLTRDEVYDLPVEFDGELTSIRLTMRHEAGAGKVAITLSTVSIGMVAGEFTYSGQMSGYVACETAEGIDRLRARMDEIEEQLGFAPELVAVGHINPERYTDQFGSDENSDKGLKEEEGSSDINNIELYRVAKGFIRILKTI